jgi:hypothetical protein
MYKLSDMSNMALRGQIEFFDNAAGLQELLYQRGFVASYMLTGDPELLAQLDRSRQSFARWLERAQAESSPGGRQDLLRIAEEHGAHEEARRQVRSSMRPRAKCWKDPIKSASRLMAPCNQSRQYRGLMEPTGASWTRSSLGAFRSSRSWSARCSSCGLKFPEP